MPFWEESYSPKILYKVRINSGQLFLVRLFKNKLANNEEENACVRKKGVF